MPKDKYPIIKNAALAFLSEFMATSILVLLGCLGCSTVPNGVTPSHLQAVIGFGFIVAVNVQIFGHLSCAHMNPCLTLAAVIMQKMSLPIALGYTLAQCLGAITGYGILMLLINVDSNSGLCATLPHPSLNSFQVLSIEALGTSILVWIFCALCFDPAYKTTRDGVAVKFGVTIIAVALVIGPYSGGSINPARSLGPAIWLGLWRQHWLYWVGPYLGTVFSAYMYRYVLSSEVLAPIIPKPFEEAEAVPLAEKRNSSA